MAPRYSKVSSITLLYLFRNPEDSILLLHMEGRTNKMALVHQGNIKYIKQNGVTHVTQDSCQSTMTPWFKRKTPNISIHMTRTAVFAERDHSQIGSWGNSPLVIRVPRHLSRDPEGQSTQLSRV